jgi:methylenetetrahydrofolate reductase (NADPH)
MRKFHEVKLFLQAQGFDLPLIGNVYVLTKTVAKMFNAGKLAGCVVADGLLAETEKYSAGADKGKQYFRELAAKQLAVFKGLGFSAGYLGGLAKPESFFEIIELANQYAADDWKTFYREIQFPQPNEFYFFDADDSATPNPLLKQSANTKNINLFYRFSRLVHALAFHRGHGLYPVMKRIFQCLEKDNMICRGCYRLVHRIEKHGKNIMYGCSDCGDCGLPDTAYLCPMNSCSKNTRNGPCGGSAKSRCEADDKDCIWTIAYDRLKYFGELERFLNAPPIVYDAALEGTSAWGNLYLDRDHSG